MLEDNRLEWPRTSIFDDQLSRRGGLLRLHLDMTSFAEWTRISCACYSPYDDLAIVHRYHKVEIQSGAVPENLMLRYTHYIWGQPEPGLRP